MRLRKEPGELKELYEKADPAGLEGIGEFIERLERTNAGYDNILDINLDNKKIQAAISYLKAPSSIDSYIAIIEENRFFRTYIHGDSKLIQMLRKVLPQTKMSCLEKMVNLKIALEGAENLPADVATHASKVYQYCKNRLSAPNLNPAEYKYIGRALNFHAKLVTNPSKKLSAGFEAPNSWEAFSSLSIFNDKATPNKEYELDNVNNLIKGVAMMVGSFLLTLTGNVALALLLFRSGEKLMNDSSQNLGLSIGPIEGMSP